jgi:maltose O-acetyltransferase
VQRSSTPEVQPGWPTVMTAASAPKAARAANPTSFVSRTMRFLRQQKSVSHLRLWLVQGLNRLIPYMVAPSVRCALYRMAGFKGIGEGVYILGPLNLRGRAGFEANLVIGAGSGVNSHCIFDLGGKITIGKQVSIGHNVVIVTTNHHLGPPSERCGSFNIGEVVIGDGAWVAAGVMVLPDVTIGRGSVVSAGSVVTKSVPANAIVAGNPARVIGWLDGEKPAQGG